MKNIKKYKITIVILVVIVIIMLFVMYSLFFRFFFRPPNSLAEVEFIHNCAELNGKVFNFQNINLLHGYSLVTFSNGGVGARPFIEQYFNEYDQFTNDRKPLRLQNSLSIPNSDSPLLIRSSASLDESWNCSIIKKTDNIIKASISYYYD